MPRPVYLKHVASEVVPFTGVVLLSRRARPEGSRSLRGLPVGCGTVAGCICRRKTRGLGPGSGLGRPKSLLQVLGFQEGNKETEKLEKEKK